MNKKIKLITILGLMFVILSFSAFADDLIFYDDFDDGIVGILAGYENDDNDCSEVSSYLHGSNLCTQSKKIYNLGYDTSSYNYFKVDTKYYDESNTTTNDFFWSLDIYTGSDSYQGTLHLKKYSFVTDYSYFYMYCSDDITTYNQVLALKNIPDNVSVTCERDTNLCTIETGLESASFDFTGTGCAMSEGDYYEELNLRARGSYDGDVSNWDFDSVSVMGLDSLPVDNGDDQEFETKLLFSDDFESYSSAIGGFDKGFLTQGFGTWACYTGETDDPNDCFHYGYDGSGSADYGINKDQLEDNKYLKLQITDGSDDGYKIIRIVNDFTEEADLGATSYTMKFSQRINSWDISSMGGRFSKLYSQVAPVFDGYQYTNELALWNGGEVTFQEDNYYHSGLRTDFTNQFSSVLDSDNYCGIYDGEWHDLTIHYIVDENTKDVISEVIYDGDTLCLNDSSISKPAYFLTNTFDKVFISTSGNSEVDYDNFELWQGLVSPSEAVSTYDEVIFEDDFDNNNLSSEGWDLDGSCFETTGHSGDSVVHTNGLGDCTITQTFDLKGQSKQDYQIGFYPLEYNAESYFKLKNSDTDWVSFQFVDLPPLDTTGNVLYLPFDTDFEDYSGLDNSVLGIGNAYIDTEDGSRGGSVVFDGSNDHVDIEVTTSNNDPLDISEDISILFDFKILDNSANNMVMLKGSAPNEYGFLTGSTGGGVVYFGGVVYSTGYTFNLDTWYNVGITRNYSTGELSFYVNGVLENSWTNSNLLPINANDLDIGDYPGNDMNGNVDEFYVFNRTLSQSEIIEYLDLSRILITGNGNCENGGAVTYESIDPVMLNYSYSFDIVTDTNTGDIDIYFGGENIASLEDYDCFITGEDKEIEFYLDSDDSIELDYFSITNKDIIAQCYDGLDNDNDGYVDFNDIDCVDENSFEDTIQETECNDGIDNDNDGFIDYPDDFGCLDELDNSEDPKQDTTCDLEECSEADKCIFLHDKACYEDITTHGFNVNPDWLSGFILPEDYNTFDVFPLNSMLQYQVITNEGLESTEFLEIRREFENTADYPLVNSRAEFFFDVQDLASNGVEQERVDYILYNGDYNDQNKILHLAMFLTTYPEISNDVLVDIFEVNTIGNFTQIGSAKTNRNYLFNRFQLNVEMNTEAQTYDVVWRGSDGAGGSQGLNYLIYTYDSPDRFSIKTYGDPIDYSTSYNAEVGIYLDELEINGKGEAEYTICNEWSKPYYLVEDFNGRITDCGWSSNKDYYFEGNLYVTQDIDIYDLYRDFSPLSSSTSRYYSTEFIFTPDDFAGDVGYVLLETFGSEEVKNYALFFSKSDNDSLEIGYFNDGDFIIVDTLSMANPIKVKAIFNFAQNTWDMLIDDTYLYEGLKSSNSLQDPTDVSRIKLFSYKSEFRFDSLSIFASDSEGTILGSDFGKYSEVLDPFPDWAGDTFCGYFQSKDIPETYCSKDSDCATSKCSPTGKCLRFDYSYCDENEMKRDGTCIVQAFAECGAENVTDGILNNFMLFLGVVVVIIIITYFIVMTRGSK